MSIFHRSGVRGLQRLPTLKYYNVLKQESRFTVGLNAAKNRHYIKKCFKWKLFGNQFCTRTSGAHICTFQGSGARGLQRLPSLKYYNALCKRVKSITVGPVFDNRSVATLVYPVFSRVGRGISYRIQPPGVLLFTFRETPCIRNKLLWFSTFVFSRGIFFLIFNSFKKIFCNLFFFSKCLGSTF